MTTPSSPATPDKSPEWRSNRTDSLALIREVSTAVPKTPPMERKKLTDEVAAPLTESSTPMLTAVCPTIIIMPMPRPMSIITRHKTT
ncbi:hypothetical protein D3C74_351730 [compost metagenome]